MPSWKSELKVRPKKPAIELDTLDQETREKLEKQRKANQERVQKFRAKQKELKVQGVLHQKDPEKLQRHREYQKRLMQERRGRSSHQPVPFTPPTPEVPAAVVLASRPPSPAKKHRHITLNEYCTHYNISDIDRSRLQKLEFLPGDPIEKLDRVEWHDEGGFQRLSWDRLLAKNREFLRDVHAGTVWSLNQL